MENLAAGKPRAVFESSMNKANPARDSRTEITSSWKGPYPLSSAQKRLWFLHELEPTVPTYSMQVVFEIRGTLDQEAMRAALEQVVNRHDVLRTRITLDGEQPVQWVLPPFRFNLPIDDFSDHLGPTLDEWIQNAILKDKQAYIDLDKEPMFRAKIIICSKVRSFLLLNIHHVISDAWSMGILFQEIETGYLSHFRPTPLELQPLPIQYLDYAHQEQQWLSGQTAAAQLKFWKENLAESINLELPTDFPRPPVKSSVGGELWHDFSYEQFTEIRKFCVSENATLFMTLLAVFKVLAYRLSGVEDVVIGAPIAGRDRLELEPLIGVFINSLALRTDLSGDPPFRELLKRVRRTTLMAYQNAKLPFEKILEEINPRRDLSRSPLFQLFFNMMSLDSLDLKLPGLEVERLKLGEVQSGFDMTIYLRQTGTSLSVQLVYAVDLYKADRMRTFLSQFLGLIDQVIQDPNRSIRSYSLVSPRFQKQLPDPGIELPRVERACVPDLIVNMALRAPEAIAVHHGTTGMTYAQLIERADWIAACLLNSGLLKGDIVAVHGKPGSGLVASLIGVLRAGGVILPIDDALPNLRIELLLSEARFRGMIEVGDPGTATAKNGNRIFLKVDPSTGRTPELKPTSADKRPSLPKLSGQDGAYVFFTSGTTGIPKGVLGTHSGLSHFLDWQRVQFEIGPMDRVPLLTSLSFDVVLREFFLPLTCGGSLHIPPPNLATASPDIMKWMEKEAITLAHLVPSVASYWFSEPVGSHPLPDLRWIFFAGEQLSGQLVNQFRKAIPGVYQVINLYGPTETTMVKSWYSVPLPALNRVQPVGHALPETQIWVVRTPRKVLSATPLDFCGPGELGEIVIRTPYRTKGYVNAREDQRTGFVPNPFGRDSEDWIYFSGDLGRIGPDGTISIVGRSDDQVKIRGVRIEPGEVAANLLNYPAVRFAVVIPTNNQEGELVLVAYVILHTDKTQSPEKLRSQLAKVLPLTFLPAQIIPIERIPLTQNGKVDHTGLPDPIWEPQEAGFGLKAPRTELEKIIQGMYQEILRKGDIGIYDDFFALGGHSLLATQLLSRISRQLNIELPLRVLFEYPTIAFLAEVLANLGAAPKETIERITRFEEGGI